MTSPTLPRDLTAQEIAAYENDGIVCLRNMFSSEWVDALRDAAEVSMQDPGELHAELAQYKKDKGRFFHDTFIWPRNEVCRQFVFESPAAMIAAKIMRATRINVFFDQWLIKEPGTATETPWHHDMTYWPIDGRQICTVWVALDPVNRDSGAVEYIKGSHSWGQKYKPASFSGGDQYKESLPAVPDIGDNRDQYDFAQFDLQPGDCTVHHGLTVHGSPGNASNTLRRRAYVSRWTGDDVVFHPREGLQEMPPMPDLDPGDSLDSDLWPRIIG